MQNINIIHNENCLTGLRKIADNSVDCCVTSPPYFGLRNYGNDEQIGLEDTPDKFVESIVAVFTEVRRVLKDEGTLWLNLGDSYAGGGGASGHTVETKNMGVKTSNYGAVKSGGKKYGLKAKDLIGIPWMVAFSLRSAGWYLRQDIIWHKPNPMPESVTDRCTKAHEYIFLLSKSAKYFYDAEAIKQNCTTYDNGIRDRDNSKLNNTPGRTKMAGLTENKYEKANKRSVWTVTTKPFSEAHFATFPQDLIVDCIKAGCPEGGIVLDPFMGAGTTAVVARRFHRNFIGFEINQEYVRMANNRLEKELGIFL